MERQPEFLFGGQRCRALNIGHVENRDDTQDALVLLLPEFLFGSVVGIGIIVCGLANYWIADRAVFRSGCAFKPFVAQTSDPTRSHRPHRP